MHNQCVRNYICPLSTITIASIEHPHLIADGVVVLHLAAEHDAARLETPVRMVREACRSLPGRHAQLIQHQEGVEVAQLRGTQRTTDTDSSPCG